MKKANFGYSTNFLFPIRFLKTSKKTGNRNPNLSTGFKTTGVSEATRKKIATAARALSWCAEPRKIRNSRGEYVQHLLSFVTLTLPSSQTETDAEITKKLLGSYLDRMRKLSLLRNYVWRAEKQRNGNIHYHLITDSYASFSIFKKMWLIVLEKYGYLQPYTAKFSNMSFTEYCRQPFNAKRTPARIAAAYAKGKRENWRNPPCVDVVSIDSPEGVQRYISKYISKVDKDNENIVTGRTWAASSSVSAAVQALKADKEFLKFWYDAATGILKRAIYETDFFSIAKCKLTSILAWFPDIRDRFIKCIRTAFEPCCYYLTYAGLFPEPAKKNR